MVLPVANNQASEAKPVALRQYGEFKKRNPWLVPTIVLVNIVMFLITMYVNDCPKNNYDCFGKFLGRLSLQPLSENPFLGPSRWTVEKMGALNISKIVNGREGWRLLTCMWLHVGFLYLLGTIMMIFMVGVQLEQEFGFVRIGLLYLISGLGGSVLYAAAAAQYSGIHAYAGASTALLGLLGGMVSELLTNRTIYDNKENASWLLIFMILSNLVFGCIPQQAETFNIAPVGGLLSGFLLGFVLLLKPQLGWVRRQRNGQLVDGLASLKPKYNIFQRIMCVTSSILLIAGFIAGFIVVFHRILPG